MLRYAIYFTFALFLAGCMSNTTKSESTASSSTAPAATEQKAAPEPAETKTAAAEVEKAASSSSADDINVAKVISYSKNSRVAGNIKAECQLEYNLPQYLMTSAADVNLVPKVSSKDRGQNLVLEITDAVSAGNAWIGHRKYVSVKGTLYKNGKKQAGFEASRVSMGGAFAAFKGSCKVLNRTVKAIAKDISIWLIDPVDGVYLGDRI
jgi:PBP1b-binding outer membrane lipoprotein LpoB